MERRASAADRRVREAVVTAKGKAATDRLDAARERMGRAVFESWDPHDFDELVRLMRKLLKNHGMAREVLVFDRLRAYGAAAQEFSLRARPRRR